MFSIHVLGARCRVQGAGCRVLDAGCRVQGVCLGVQGFPSLGLNLEMPGGAIDEKSTKSLSHDARRPPSEEGGFDPFLLGDSESSGEVEGRSWFGVW